MALITCPECGKEVSDQAETCPYCGYPIKEKAMAAVAATIAGTTVEEAEASVATTEPLLNETVTPNGYDVMLVDYNCSDWNARSRLSKGLNISRSDARAILDACPTYLYNDVTREEAFEITNALTGYGMRIAIYDPSGNVQYYAPMNYDLPLPVIVRYPRRRVIPVPVFAFRTHRNEPRFGGPSFQPSHPSPSRPQSHGFGFGSSKPSSPSRPSGGSSHSQVRSSSSHSSGSGGRGRHK